NDNMRVTCTVAGDIGIYQQMSTQPFIGRNCLLLIRYRSTTSVSITVTAGGGQVGPLTLLGTLPSSSGTLNIYCIPIAKITDPLQTWMEFWKTGWLVGEYVELEEVLFVDSGAIDNGRLSF
ncbi:MAG: hypothetical protein Q8M65_07935, partial [Rhodoglobus sp.]|nr:hypothetical protein [Rhodoglobus sp.]